MQLIANGLDKRFRLPASRHEEIRLGDVLFWRKRYMGFRIGKEVLWLDTRTPCSLRTRLCNLTSLSGPVYRYPRKPEYAFPFTEEYLTQYFAENEDNPYAIWNYFQQFTEHSQNAELTQLPPLAGCISANIKQRQIEEMRSQALPGDMVFTYDRTSGLARLIRKYDWGMWTHGALVNASKDLTEATTSGVIESSFYRLSESALDVGLYRLPDLTDDERKHAIDFMDHMTHKPTTYNWYGVVRILMHKRFHIPYKRKPTEVTPNEMIYANVLKLVCYA